MVSLDEVNPMDVIRRFDRRFRKYKNVGWVYIMKNESLPPGVLKIGKTYRPPHYRAQELGMATSIPTDFEIIYFVHVSDMHAAEAQVHSALGTHRVSPKKEFFSAPLIRFRAHWASAPPRGCLVWC